MVSVLLELSPDGLLRGFRATGHAGRAAAGGSIACAAVTTLLRTAARLCAEWSMVEGGGADSPGAMDIVLSRKAEAEPSGWLRGVSDFLLRGLSDIQGEFPGEVAVRVLGGPE